MKKTNRLLPLLIGFLSLVNTSAFSQVTLNAAGGSKQIANQNFEWSIGEMILVNTDKAGNIIVTQGLLQPMDQSTGIDYLPINEKIALNVYPNPATQDLYIAPHLKPGSILHYEFYDAHGRLMDTKQQELQSGEEIQKVDLSPYAAGNYMLKARIRQGKEAAQQTFKIQKLN